MFLFVFVVFDNIFCGSCEGEGWSISSVMCDIVIVYYIVMVVFVCFIEGFMGMDG